MNDLIRASLKNPYAVIVAMLTILVIGVLCLLALPIDILPIFRSPAVQVLTFYSGMPAVSVEKDITNRLERLGRPGQQHEPAGVALDHRVQRHPQLFPG